MGYIAQQRVRFDPRSLGGLVLWLRADKGVVFNGGTISRWNDQSGYRNDATQGTAGSQPTLHNNVINRQKVIRFDGGDSLAVTDNASLQNQNGSMFMVVKCPTLHTHCLAGNEDFNLDRYGFMMWGNSSQVNAEIANASTYQVKTTNLFYGDNVPHTLGMIYSATEIQAWMDGLTFTTPTTRSITMAWNGYNFTIGNVPTGANRFYTGDIAEILYFNYALSHLQRLTLQRYLSLRYRTF